jgi:MFS family permease
MWPVRLGLPRNAIVLSWVSFFQDAASELLYPVFPLFITVTLGAPASVLGLIEGVAEGTASVGKALSGRLADRFRRRPLIALGYGISSAAKPFIGLAGVWPVAMAGRFVDRVGKGLRTSPRDALLAADTPPEIRGRAFGFHRAADTAGAVVGPLLGLALYELLDHRLRPLFFVAAVPAAISVGLIALVREHPPAEDEASEPVVPRSPAELPARYWRVVGVLALFSLANFSDALLILRAKALGLSFVSVIVAYTLYNATYAGLSLPAGIVSDRLPRRLVYATGLLIFAIAYIGLGLARSGGWVWVLLPLYGGYTALTDGVGKAWVADLLPASALGSGLGLFQGVIGGCTLVASVWAGLAWGGDGATPLVISGAVVGVLAVGLLATGRRLD